MGHTPRAFTRYQRSLTGLYRPLCRVEVPPELVLVALLAEKDEAAFLRHAPGGQVVDVAGQVGVAKTDL